MILFNRKLKTFFTIVLSTGLLLGCQQKGKVTKTKSKKIAETLKTAGQPDQPGSNPDSDNPNSSGPETQSSTELPSINIDEDSMSSPIPIKITGIIDNGTAVCDSSHLSYTTSNPSPTFSLGPATWGGTWPDCWVSFAPQANAEGSSEIQITATIGANSVLTNSFKLEILPVNDAPTDIILTSTSIAENAGTNAVVSVLSSTDADSGDTFTYSLVAGAGDTDNGSFNLNSGNLRLSASADFEVKNSYAVRLRTTDAGGLSFDRALIVTVTNVNEPTTNITLSSSTVLENAGANTVVGALSSTDQDAGDTYTYSLVTGTGDSDNGSFNINSGNLRLTASANFEVKNSYDIRLRTTDAGGLFFEKAFTITVTNVNESPTNLTLSSSSVLENSGANAVVGALSSADPDSGDTFTYSLVTGTGDTDNGSFNINSGNLRLTANGNYDVKNSYDIRLRTTDAGGLTFDKAFTVTVTNANGSPTDITLSSSTVPEKAGANVVVGALSSTDPDAGETFAYSLVVGSGDTDNGSFNINSGNLRLTASADYDLKNSYAVRLRTTDAGGLFFEEAFTVTVTKAFRYYRFTRLRTNGNAWLVLSELQLRNVSDAIISGTYSPVNTSMAGSVGFWNDSVYTGASAAAISNPYDSGDLIAVQFDAGSSVEVSGFRQACTEDLDKQLKNFRFWGTNDSAAAASTAAASSGNGWTLINPFVSMPNLPAIETLSATTAPLVPTDLFVGHLSGSNGSNTFLDFSINSAVGTAFGNALVSSTQTLFSQNGSYFDGFGDYLTFPHSSALDLSGRPQWTIQFWVYQNSRGVGGNIIGKDAVNLLSYPSYSVNIDASGNMNFNMGNGNNISSLQQVSIGTLPLATWTHVAAVVDHSKIYTIRAGALISNTNKTVTITDGGKDLYIGNFQGGSAAESFDGFVREAVITPTALWDYSYTTPPAAPWKNPSLAGSVGDYISKKLAVLFQGPNNSTTFADSGANAASITAYNGAKITTATFAQGSSSGEFVRSSNSYLYFDPLAALNFGTGDFTIKFRARLAALPGVGQNYTVIRGLATFDNTVPSIQFGDLGSGTVLRLVFPWLGVNIQSSTLSLSANTWYDFEVSRTGSAVTLKQGGISVGSGTFAGNVNLSAGGTAIGGDSASNNFDGQLDELVVE